MSVKLLFVALFIFGLEGIIFAQSPAPSQGRTVESLFDGDTASRLKLEGELSRTNFDDRSITLVPRYGTLRNLLEANIKELGPNIISECLSLYKKPEAANKQAWTEAEKRVVYNELLAVSTLKGLQYFSRRRGKMHTLYDLSFVIDSPESNTPLPDPNYQTIPGELNLFVRQKDSTFGNNVYSFKYTSAGTSGGGDSAAMFLISQRNVTKMDLLLVPVVSENNLRSYVALIDAGPYFVIYAASIVNVSLLPGLKDQISSSINNRTLALLSWFSQRADAAYNKLK
jgi:hypothetical protein